MQEKTAAKSPLYPSFFTIARFIKASIPSKAYSLKCASFLMMNVAVSLYSACAVVSRLSYTGLTIYISVLNTAFDCLLDSSALFAENMNITTHHSTSADPLSIIFILPFEVAFNVAFQLLFFVFHLFVYNTIQRKLQPNADILSAKAHL